MLVSVLPLLPARERLQKASRAAQACTIPANRCKFLLNTIFAICYGNCSNGQSADDPQGGEDPTLLYVEDIELTLGYGSLKMAPSSGFGIHLV